MKKSALNILIVDDDISIRDSLHAAVKRRGFKPVAVSRAEEALSLMKMKDVHAALIDCMLPRMNGVDLAVELHKIKQSLPILLFSGVFRDRTFASDAVARAKAIDFLYKPLDIETILNYIDHELEDLIDPPKVALHLLLTQAMATVRDRQKALEGVEEVQGFDLPLIVSILMESRASGHLNLVSSHSEIYGITFAKGGITHVDTPGGSLNLGMLLIKHGFITSQELEVIGQRRSSGDLIQALVSENLVSPHAGPIIKTQLVLTEMANLVNGQTMQLSFVPDDKVRESDAVVTLRNFQPLLQDLIENQISADWYRKFYEQWMDHPMKMGPEASRYDEIKYLPVFKRLPSLFESLKDEPTLEDLLSSGQYSEAHIYRAIHYLAVRRMMVFDEDRRSLNLDDLKQRFGSLKKELVGKNPEEVFRALGAPSGEELRREEVEKIFKIFLKANHPDLLPPHAPQDLRKLNTEVFALVSAAHEVLCDPSKKQKYQEELKHQTAKNQMQAEDLLERANQFLQRGAYSEGLELANKAEALFPTPKGELLSLWAKLKLLPKQVDAKTTERLLQFSDEDRRTELFQLVLGLARMSKGDAKGAASAFQRALTLNKDFLVARRELTALVQAHKSSKLNAKDIFTGDISSVMKQILKK